MQIKESLPVGTILDSGVRKYVIKSVLGQGGFGITYLATSTIQVGNIPAVMQFAIKEHYISTMNKRQGTSVAISNENNTAEIKESIDSFLVEAQRLNRLSLNHPGIVRVNESFRANGTAYYVMEYIKGQSLREYVKRSPQGRLSEDEALKMFRPIAETIGYLHENRVTHLDIKPDNILIRENGEPVVIDFGLSKHYSSKGTPTSAIKAAGCSAGYSPMEQYVGITTFTPEADIYALGATLLYVLTGKDPMISTEINEDIIRRSIPQDVSQQTTNAIVHAMEKLKENRTHNVSDFFSRIELLEQNNVDNSTDNNKTRKLKNPKQTLNREKPSSSLKPIEAIKLASSRILDFKGKSGRTEFWWTILAIVIVYVACVFLENIFDLNYHIEVEASYIVVIGKISSFLGPIIAVLSSSLQVRRLHDIGFSALWAIIPCSYICFGDFILFYSSLLYFHHALFFLFIAVSVLYILKSCEKEKIYDKYIIWSILCFLIFFVFSLIKNPVSTPLNNKLDLHLMENMDSIQDVQESIGIANPIKGETHNYDVAKEKNNEQTNENKEKPKELSDKELFSKAKSNNDWATIEKLGNKGYASAYYELARHYYNIGNEQMCKKWAEKAVATNVNKKDAEKLLEDLK